MKPASQKQIDFLNKLIDQKDVNSSLKAEIEKMIVDGMTIKGASRLIESLLAEPNKPIAGAVTEPGFYQNDNGIFKVKLSQSNRFYALELQENCWEYAPGAMHKIKSDDKMTLERAKQYGRMTGKCILCNRLLTNENSISEGIGPICASRF